LLSFGSSVPFDGVSATQFCGTTISVKEHDVEFLADALGLNIPNCLRTSAKPPIFGQHKRLTATRKNANMLASDCGTSMTAEIEEEIVHFLVKNIDFVRQVKQWKTDPVLAHKSWRKKRHQMDHKNRTHAMKKMRIVLEEMSGGHFDENCRYVKEDGNSEWIKWENQNTRKRRRLNNDDYFNINDKIMRPFVRSSNMFHFERLKISPLEANYCIKGLFQIQHSNPVISGLDYSSRRKTFHLNRVDIWLSDHFKNQLTFGKS